MKRSPVKPTQLPPETVCNIEAAVFKAVEQQLAEAFFLLDVTLEKESGYWYLRIYVEKPGDAISLSECEAISRELEPLIDELPQLNDFSYSLEISSPGLFRPLRRQREFAFFIGKPVRVEAMPSQAKGAKKLPAAVKAKANTDVQEGILQDYDAERRVVILQRSAGGEGNFEVPLDDTKVVYLNPVIHFPDDEAIPDGEELPETTDN